MTCRVPCVTESRDQAERGGSRARLASADRFSLEGTLGIGRTALCAAYDEHTAGVERSSSSTPSGVAVYLTAASLETGITPASEVATGQ